ncbi:cbb3-type cytochrome oxidase assembly protein CcoS [Hugenholtzia roseola]|uniref:cbb3-type cytochrome oxidase assembly protein CcoS n=1 Tax=Hugenholtzia roseola TaxID=1002 RepID=UPI0003FEC8BC|nr:cbb3-type cytochrome oxidase assembly protein CcoS [Hugenholtzia roseola]
MSAILILILVSLLVALGFLAAFLISVRGGQYEDTYTPSLRILLEDEPKHANRSEQASSDGK